VSVRRLRTGARRISTGRRRRLSRIWWTVSSSTWPTVTPC